MYTQIVSEAEDFVISHRCMFLEQRFMSCHQRESVHHRISAIWQKKIVGLTVWYKKIKKKSEGITPAETMALFILKAYDFKRWWNNISGIQSQLWIERFSVQQDITEHRCAHIQKEGLITLQNMNNIW